MYLERLPEFSANHPQLFLALGAIVVMLSLSYLRAMLQKFKAIGPLEATQLINHQDALVLDIREPRELAEGVILDSRHIPLGQLKSSLQQLEKYKQRPIIASCRTGSRSSAACATLMQGGFEQVYNLKGGIMAWRNANLPLTKKS